MPWQLRLAAVTMVSLLLMAAVAGCGVPKVKITGTLTKNGQPYTVRNDTYVTLVFTPDTEKADQTYPAKFNHETGGYEVEVPAGMYRTRYVIVEKNQAPIIAPPQATTTVHDLTASKVLDLELTPK